MVLPTPDQEKKVKHYLIVIFVLKVSYTYMYEYVCTAHTVSSKIYIYCNKLEKSYVCDFIYEIAKKEVTQSIYPRLRK